MLYGNFETHIGRNNYRRKKHFGVQGKKSCADGLLSSADKSCFLYYGEKSYRGCEFAIAKVWEKGGEGGIELAEKVLSALEKESRFQVLYEDSLSVTQKIETVAKKIYGAGSVSYTSAALKQIEKLESLGYGALPVCMAKNQYSLSDDPNKLGRPTGFDMSVREVYVSAGAGFIVVLTGAIVTMPGLSKNPAAYGIDVDEDGVITGLF